MLAVPVLLILIGSVAYHFLEILSLFDSLYLSVITLTTIGYGDVYPRTTGGRLFTIFLALGGIFTLFYVAAEVIRMVIGGEVRAVLARRPIEQNLTQLKNHLIVSAF